MELVTEGEGLISLVTKLSLILSVLINKHKYEVSVTAILFAWILITHLYVELSCKDRIVFL